MGKGGRNRRAVSAQTIGRMKKKSDVTRLRGSPYPTCRWNLGKGGGGLVGKGIAKKLEGSPGKHIMKICWTSSRYTKGQKRSNKKGGVSRGQGGWESLYLGVKIEEWEEECAAKRTHQQGRSGKP